MTEHQHEFPEPGSVDETFHPQDAIGGAVKNATMLGGAGLFLAAVQNTMAKQNLGAIGVFSRFGTTTALFAAMGGSYAFVQMASANLRQKNDAYNHAIGGFVAGTLPGLMKRSMPSVLGNGLALSTVLGVAAYSGSYMFGSPDLHPDEGRWPTKEEMRKRFRRPANETINELGEGRGIYGPNYQERRADRIKQNHGVDVPKPYWETQAEPEPYRAR